MRINATLAVNSILTHNISLRAGQPCLILHSDEKVRLAEEFARQLALRGCSAEDLFLPKAAIDSTDWVAGVRNRLTHFGGARIILLDHWMVQSPIMDGPRSRTLWFLLLRLVNTNGQPDPYPQCRL